MFDHFDERAIIADFIWKDHVIISFHLNYRYLEQPGWETLLNSGLNVARGEISLEQFVDCS